MYIARNQHIKKYLAGLWLLAFVASLNVYHHVITKLKPPRSSLRIGENPPPHGGPLQDTGSHPSKMCQLNWTELVSWTPVIVNISSPSAHPSVAYSRDSRGVWYPDGCRPRSELAVVVPYRDRAEHLDLLLENLHGILRLQKLAYLIYVVEQVEEKKLNRGALRNIGFTEANKVGLFRCYIFHDVDLIPENASNLYSCSDKQPLHLSSAVDSLQYRVPYKEIFGGVVALSKTQFESVNGYSNRFFHWGGEDDDMYSRLYRVGWRIQRQSLQLGRYKMLHHDKSIKNPYRFLQGWYDIKTDQWQSDGLKDLNYTVTSYQQHQLCTRLLVDLDDSKADHFIQDAIEEIRSSLPERYRSLSDKTIGDAVIQLQQYYRGPYQVLKVIEQGVKAINPFIS